MSNTRSDMNPTTAQPIPQADREINVPASETPSRRAVLATFAACGCCAMAGSVAGADPKADPEDKVPAGKPGRSDVGATADFAQDGVYDAHSRTVQVMLVRTAGVLHASSSVCTHKRCVLKKGPAGDALKCPCHKSDFDLAGIPIMGPAKTPLPRYAIAVENGRVFVDTSKSFDEKQWADPAASVKLG